MLRSKEGSQAWVTVPHAVAKVNNVKSGHWINRFQGHHRCMPAPGELCGGYCHHAGVG